MLLHEHGLFLRKCHVHTPELVNEILVSGDKVGKRLCQHPRDCECYNSRMNA
jgi:hypothetical protein